MVGSPASAADDFYTTFWSLQRFFSNPPLLFAPATSPVASTSAAPQAEPFAALQHGLARTLTEFAGATKKERALSGKADGKQKAVAVLPEVAAAEQVAVELGTEGGQLDHYFFPKFLTSRNLLELEVCQGLRGGAGWRAGVLTLSSVCVCVCVCVCLGCGSCIPAADPGPDFDPVPIPPGVHARGPCGRSARHQPVGALALRPRPRQCRPPVRYSTGTDRVHC